jgi:hypothetical protein
MKGCVGEVYILLTRCVAEKVCLNNCVAEGVFMIR